MLLYHIELFSQVVFCFFIAIIVVIWYNGFEVVRMDIGTKIKIQRKKAGLTQIERAKKADRAGNSIRLYEGRKRIPNLATVQKIADALDLDIRDLVMDDTNDGREYEELTSILEDAGIEIEEAGPGLGPGPDQDYYYVWLKTREDEEDFSPDDEKELYTYAELRNIVRAVVKDAETNKQRYICHRLIRELFWGGWNPFFETGSTKKEGE